MKSHQISAFFLLMTVLLSSTLAQHSKRKVACCFIYFPGKLRMNLIARYEETRADCPKPGIVFNTTNGYGLCVDPSSRWVQRVMKRLDQRLPQ